VLGFRTNEKSDIHYWPVVVVPEGYLLRGEVHGDVQSLVNGFKIAYQSSMSGGARALAPPAGAAGGRTPGYPAVAAGGRTPAGLYGGGAGTGRTPNPYGMQQPPPGVVAAMGGRTPNAAYGGGRTPNPYGGPPPPVHGYGGGYGQR